MPIPAPSDLQALATLEKQATQGTWNACTANQESGGCPCGLVWFEQVIDRPGMKPIRIEDTVVSCCHAEMLAKGAVVNCYNETMDGAFGKRQQAANMLFVAAIRNAAPGLLEAADRLHRLEAALKWSFQAGLMFEDADSLLNTYAKVAP